MLPRVVTFSPKSPYLFSLRKCCRFESLEATSSASASESVSQLSSVPAAAFAQPVLDFRHFSSWWDLAPAFGCIKIFIYSFIFKFILEVMERGNFTLR